MQFIEEGKVKNYPDFIMAGCGKAGTTSIHNYLKVHPSIVMPASMKETLFFHIISNPNRSQLQITKAIDNIEDYVKEFQGATADQICGEICPSYLSYYQHTISNILRIHPKPDQLKILIILRDPVDRAISAYKFCKHKVGSEKLSIKEAIKDQERREKDPDILPGLLYVYNSSYYEKVRAFQKAFRQVKVLYYDDLKEDRKTFIKNLYEYLGVDPDFIPPNLNQDANQTSPYVNPKIKGLRAGLTALRTILPKGYPIPLGSKVKESLKRALFSKEELDTQTIENLRTTFIPEIEQLEELLEKDLSHWKS